MSNFTFAADSITVSGKTYKAGYSVTPSGSVMVFVTLPDAAEVQRIRFPQDHPDHAAALAAAKAERAAHEAEAVQEQPAAEPVPQEDDRPPYNIPAANPPETIHTEIDGYMMPSPVDEAAAQEEPAEAAAETVQPAQEEPAPRTIPAKDFIGETITGHGWRILFDGETSRTRVIFDADPTDAARAALDKAGFYFSPVMKSYNKKLTHKAHRAAVALSGELRALYA
jgi:hypothetical protein